MSKPQSHKNAVKSSQSTLTGHDLYQQNLPPKWCDSGHWPKALYSVAQIRQIEMLAIGGVNTQTTADGTEAIAATPGIVLMKRAAEATLEAILALRPQLRVLTVFCGAGNNGGDGYLVGKLACEQGIQVEIVDVGNEQADGRTLKGDAKCAYEAACAAGVPVIPLHKACLKSSELIVDAMVGIGLCAPLRGNIQQAIAAINAADVPVVAVDVPSGLCADTGCVLDKYAVEADITVTFIGLKKGLLTGQAVDYVGDVRVDDLGVPQTVFQQLASEPIVRRLDLDTLKTLIPKRAKSSYKHRSGHVVIVGGDKGMVGAVALAASAAMHLGAGMVTVATHQAHIATVLASQPQVMAVGVSGYLELCPLLARADIIVVGPGLGQSAWSQQLLLAVAEAGKPCVVDADAINLIAQNPDLMPQSDSVFTPHTGESARLLHCTSDQINRDRFAAVALLRNMVSGRTQQTEPNRAVVLKGAGTLISAGDTVSLCPYGNAALATAGMGDVLSGMIAALLAQKLSMPDAVALAVVLHAAAADLYVQQCGMSSLLASELPIFSRKLTHILSQHEQ